MIKCPVATLKECNLVGKTDKGKIVPCGKCCDRGMQDDLCDKGMQDALRVKRRASPPRLREKQELSRGGDT